MFKITDLKKPNFDSEIKKQISFEGLELTLRVRHDNDFLTAIGRVYSQMDKEKTLNKDSLKRGQMASSEALFFVIGEYVVSDWNVVDDNNTPVPINGDNFLAVLEDVENLTDFLVLLMAEFNKAMSEFGQAVENLKKKSLKPMSGKK